MKLSSSIWLFAATTLFVVACADMNRVVKRGGGGNSGGNSGGEGPPPSTPSGPVEMPSASIYANNPDWPEYAIGQSGQEDFMVRFDAPSRPIPPGLATGLNDLQNAHPGVWRAWGKVMQPQGGLVRIWVKYYLASGVNDSHIAAAKAAQKEGLDVFLTVVGAMEDRGREGVGTEEAILAPPKDVDAWCRKVEADVQKLRNAGVNVPYVEIWNEPDLPKSWDGTSQEFARFFAEAGNQLRKSLPKGTRIGGPGLGSGWGNGMDWFKDISRESKRAGFIPDYLSYHHYGSYPTDSSALETGQRIETIATEAGLPKPEIIVSEWNVILPRPVAMELDDHRGAVNFVSMTAGLMNTSTTHSLFFFLQDGNWEAKDEYGGQSVGVFTLIGAPKSVLTGMRMMRTFSEQPLVPRERWTAPQNLSMAATRDGKEGRVVVANYPGIVEKGVRKFMDWRGLELALLKNKDREIRSYMNGRSSYSSLKLDEKWRPILEDAKEQMGILVQEAKKRDRWVTIRLEGKPKRIGKVVLIDKDHGNPMDDRGFQATFAPYEKGLSRAAMDEALVELKKQGVSQGDIQKLESAFKSKSKSAPNVSSKVQAQARTAYARARERISDELPSELVSHESTYPSQVDASSWARLDGDILSVRVPPFTAVMVDLVW